MRAPGQQGAGLIEVAVALLVISVGALGLARGQLAARQAAGEALQRSEAVLLASGLLEQVRGNPDALTTYTFGNLRDIQVPRHDCSQQSCTAIQWGSWNLWHWLQDLRGSAGSVGQDGSAAGLIAPDACLSVSQADATLKLSWRADLSQGSNPCSEPESFTRAPVLALQTRLEAPGG